MWYKLYRKEYKDNPKFLPYYYLVQIYFGRVLQKSLRVYIIMHYNIYDQINNTT